jgi:hypothetical protein
MSFTSFANEALGRRREANTNNRFENPGTTISLPRIVSVYAMCAASTAVIPEFSFLTAIPARARNSDWVIPGQNTVTVTPVPSSSFRSEVENERRKDLQAL